MGEIRGRNLAIAPEQLFAELSAEVADLAEMFARTILNVEINSVIAQIAEVERIAEVLRASSGCRSDCAEVEKPIDQPAGYRGENAIAARVLDLHDRLGGFIMPQLSQQSGQST
jgi:hypothetical protein